MSVLQRSILSCAVAGTLFGFGCTTLEDNAIPEEPLSSVAQANAQHIQIGQDMLDAFRAGKAETFVGLLPANLQQQFGVKEFEGARKSLLDTIGEITGYHLLAELKHPLVKVYIWQVDFTRKSSEGTDIEQEILLKVIISELDGKPQIISFVFI